MAAASNFMVGQRDFQLGFLRRLSSDASTSSAIDVVNGSFSVNGFRVKVRCSDNYGNILRENKNNNKDFRNGIGNGNGNGNGVQKAWAYAPCLEQMRRRSDEGDANRGSCSGVVEQPLPEKMMVAVDVDEVLGNFVSALNHFIADRYSLNHTISEYHVYEFFKIWKCSRDEADIRVHEFFKTSYFKKGIYPIPGAQMALQKLSKFCNLSIVTSRQNAIKDHTIEWIDKHYPGLFQEIHFGNHFALDGQSRPKSDICKCLGAKVLIDDNPRYAIECAEVGIKVLLFDYENSYPWCKTAHVFKHPLVTKVHNWEEVEHQLASWIVSQGYILQN